ncbi:NucA/NucB deoxyribonuclease domain-containing protein [Paenibacillus sp. HWE-109]|uniref:NucA/NucB deoxyribonuclease domain-containing protein n=1 Tax=Paenibacillus sp. HWE-109 TaxID=1306526 RepID=UPI001EE0FFD8|nr:NucA/NucB deoxyribonuclease domain-containing protein [Paenibacillus sp. HWE-109]UKS31045.1 NucA/NucB deoxyribonuclease domain-containing protein [Paenibacillus sp. HWE-109]
MKKSFLFLIVMLLAVATSYYLYNSEILQGEEGVRVTITFPSDRYPETAAHIRDAISNGKSSVCTIDRVHAEEHRKLSLKGVATKSGFDRDEWPMAMCSEGGKGADIRYVSPSDNRGAGSWFSNQLEKYPNGTRVAVQVK